MTSPFSAAAADASPLGCGEMISCDDLPLCRWLRQRLLLRTFITVTMSYQIASVACKQ